MLGEPWHEDRRQEIECLNDKKTQELEMTHLGQAQLVQPLLNALKQSHRVIGPCRRRDQIKIVPVTFKIECINDNPVQNDKTTHLKCASAAQPPIVDSVHAYGVIGSRRQHGRIKLGPTNVSQTRNGGRTHLGCAITIRSIWRPIKGIRRLEELTFESRMLGELWHDVDDYR